MNVSASASPSAPADHCHIAICGAGPVGMACAALLVAEGHAASDIVLIDSRSLQDSVQDPRSLALSDGSRRILQRIGGWTAKATPIRQIHVSRRGYPGRALMDASDYGLDALGHVARYGDVIAALAASPFLSHAGVRTLRPVRVTGIDTARQPDGKAGVLLNTSSGTIHAGMLIQAEGRWPGAASEAAIPARDYQQTALVAHVTCSRFQADRAYERFTHEGPLALLPQENGYSLVWCVHRDNADALLAPGDTAFLAALQQRFGDRVGQFLSVTPRHSFPLLLHNGRETLALAASAPALQSGLAVVHIGNSAQTLHPVAGQGLNLGLRDAQHLSRWLALHGDSNRNQPEQLLAVLASFRQRRAKDRQQTIGLTDLMARIFISPEQVGSSGSLIQSALGLSLSCIDAAGPVRRRLARQMMYGAS